MRNNLAQSNCPIEMSPNGPPKSDFNVTLEMILFDFTPTLSQLFWLSKRSNASSAAKDLSW